MNKALMISTIVYLLGNTDSIIDPLHSTTRNKKAGFIFSTDSLDTCLTLTSPLTNPLYTWTSETS